MATKSIAWSTGTGNITLTYSGQGNDTVIVESDYNDLDVDRQETITFSTGSITRTAVVSQKTSTEQGSSSCHPTSYNDGYSAYSVSNLDSAYADSSSTTYAQVNLTRGSGAETEIYYNFGSLSAIPANATILSVTCSCKLSINTTTASRVATREAQLYSGTTAKGSASTVANSTTAFSMTCGTWTRDELQNAKIRLHAVRGSSSTTTNYYFRFYGATLTVTWKNGKYLADSEHKLLRTSDGYYLNTK